MGGCARLDKVCVHPPNPRNPRSIIAGLAMFKNSERLAYYTMIVPGLVLLFAFTFVPLAD